MHTEFEAMFSGVEPDSIRNKLKAIGAACVHPEYMMKRVVFSPPQSNDVGYLRVRQEADTATMTYKVNNGTQIHEQKEVELVIDDFDTGVAFCAALGAKQKSYQETKREVWQLDQAEIVIDTWPGLRPFIEVEAPNEATVRSISEALGFDYGAALFGAVHLVYELELGIPPDVINNQTPIITFEQPPQAYDR